MASPSRTHLGSSARRFVSYVDRLTQGHEIVSLTGRVPAARWLPLDEPPASLAWRLCLELAPLSALLEFLHHPYLPSEWLVWRNAERVARSRGWKSQKLGDPSLGLLGAVTRIGGCLESTTHEPAEARRTLRLGSRRTILVSVADGSVTRLTPLLRGLASMGTDAPQLLVIGHRTASITRAAQSHGVASLVRPLGLTRGPSLVFRAVDGVAVLPSYGHSSGGGGFIADARASGLPVIADPAASGAWMLAESELVMRGDWSKALDRIGKSEHHGSPLFRWHTAESLAAKLVDVNLCSTKRA